MRTTKIIFLVFLFLTTFVNALPNLKKGLEKKKGISSRPESFNGKLQKNLKNIIMI